MTNYRFVDFKYKDLRASSVEDFVKLLLDAIYFEVENGERVINIKLDCALSSDCTRTQQPYPQLIIQVEQDDVEYEILKAAKRKISAKQESHERKLLEKLKRKYEN